MVEKLDTFSLVLELFQRSAMPTDTEHETFMRAFWFCVEAEGMEIIFPSKQHRVAMARRLKEQGVDRDIVKRFTDLSTRTMTKIFNQ